VSHFDLNGDPNLRQPYGASAMKTLCCGPCKSGPITAQFSVQKQGFVPGEDIHFRVEFNNGSSHDLKDIEVTLWQHLILHAQNHRKRDSRKVASVSYAGKISERSAKIWDSGFIAVPPVSPSSNGICKLIETSYLILLEFSVSGPSTGTNCSIPCVIGTIPLTSDNGDSSQSMASGQFSYEPSAFAALSTYPYLGYPPAAKGDMVQSDAATYKPMYPYYKNLSG
jgi:hypothetical protein